MAQVATETEVRELAKLHDVSLYGVTSHHEDYYRFTRPIDDFNYERVDVTMTGKLVSNHDAKEITQWIQSELHDYNQ